MRDPGSDRATMVMRRENMLNAAYRLFSEKSITAVTLDEIAREAGCGKKTLLRYYNSKPGLVIAVAGRQWEQFMAENRKRSPDENFDGMTAEEVFVFYLDSFLELYRNHRDLLRYNQLFNVYIQSVNVDPGAMRPYEEMIRNLAKRFHIVYEKAERDHTIRTDVPEMELFSTTLHLMLAAVTRYAVGLAFRPEGFDALKELEFQKEAILAQYRVRQKY